MPALLRCTASCLVLSCSTRHGYNSTLSKEVVYRLELSLSNISTMVEELAMDMFTVS
jgi:hypothetical protein